MDHRQSPVSTVTSPSVWSVLSTIVEAGSVAVAGTRTVHPGRSRPEGGQHGAVGALAIVAHAFVSVMTATQPNNPDGLITFTRNEIRRLLATATHILHSIERVLNWSHWRRQHHATARASHYRKQSKIT
jgi:hypothetical protein